MAIWIANKDKYGEYQFDEKIWPNWYIPKEIIVSNVRYHRNIIENSKITYYIYTSQKLVQEDLLQLRKDWLSFCVPW